MCVYVYVCVSVFVCQIRTIVTDLVYEKKKLTLDVSYKCLAEIIN